ncbi:SRPBCC family protein [Pedobacter sp.]|uniref:SRPBCC family protein n=1 Tax=Pedobacter sp. TaxID=1411316 RepID=UPI003BAC7BEE
MELIVLTTHINAPVEKCFDLSRNIDLHLDSMHQSKEKAIDGKTAGLIEMGESVTWLAKHFGISFRMTSQITLMEKPLRFIDEMTNGPFKSLKHLHQFKVKDRVTEMTDVFEFEVPFGFVGWLVEKSFLKFYMKKLLMERNRFIKAFAEKS